MPGPWKATYLLLTRQPKPSYPQWPQTSTASYRSGIRARGMATGADDWRAVECAGSRDYWLWRQHFCKPSAPARNPETYLDCDHAWRVQLGQGMYLSRRTDGGMSLD